MSERTPARTVAGRARRPFLAVLVVVCATLVGVLAACQSLAVTSARSSASSSPLSAPAIDTSGGDRRRSRVEAATEREDRRLEMARHGSVPDGVTVFDDHVPAVANLDPELLDALREAATDAADDGVEFYVNSGWRSTAYQNQLLREAISEHGSAEEAARWVATAQTSPHVSGDAVDIGHSDATSWLSDNGATYGLCQIYDNEPWHYELRPEADDHGCPVMYADPTRDPRMWP